MNEIYRPHPQQPGAFQRTEWQLMIMSCPNCKEDTLMLGRARQDALKLHPPLKWDRVFPQGSSRSSLPPEVPDDVASDYKEASVVLPHSPKASAALSRRCLQTVLREAGGYKQYDLAKQIDAALDETDTRKALPLNAHTTLDAIRHIGNFAAHKITDKTTLELIDVEPHEAEFCLDVLDVLFEHYYVRPAQAQRAKDELNKKLVAAGKKPIP
ncbi:DUF4145 domain-containing protein [Bradyrhizobium yuanmingense]|uniref:DUF4145 domain-containing protein n=1 Tax=Bradyrhizobium yuanmingense TaxID=108015 RepID=UPI0018D21206|nr:DUF4145 domain-containing protein [Bradyrhizobium yuanmingense]